jgi:hypothetical protein
MLIESELQATLTSRAVRPIYLHPNITHTHALTPADANLDLRVGLGKTIASIASIPTVWQWTYTSASSGLVADVSYDLWLSKTAGTGGASSSSTFEMCVVRLTFHISADIDVWSFSMVWLSTRGGCVSSLCYKSE